MVIPAIKTQNDSGISQLMQHQQMLDSGISQTIYFR